MNGLQNFRVIFFTHYTELYGANKSLLNLIDGLAIKGIADVLVVSPATGKITEALDIRNVPYKIIPFVNEIYEGNSKQPFFKMLAKLIYNWSLVLRYSAQLKIRKKTIIHSNSSATLTGAYFSWWLRIPHIWHIREFGVTDYRFQYNFGNRYFNYWLDKADAAVAISNSIYDKRLTNRSMPLKKMIYNGIFFKAELNEEKLYRPYGKNEGFVFGIIGHISEEKGHPDAIEAFHLFNKKNSNSLLAIAGTGSDEFMHVLKEKIAVFELEKKVIFYGYVTDTEKFYSGIDILLMCSKNEGLGRVTIEAMRYNVPVIGYNNAGTAEIIEDNYNGLLYNGTVDDLFKKMEYTYNNNLDRIKKNALNTVKERFTIEQYADNIYELYNVVKSE